MKNEIPIGSAGWVKLVDTMPQTDLDLAVVQAARTSNGTGSKGLQSDTSLIRYLMRHRHTSPFEMVEFKFHLKMPIFVARQWMRHRMASINEYSGRYAEIPNECWIPNPYELRTQSGVNKQSSDPVADYSEDAGEFSMQFKNIYSKIYKVYKKAVDMDVAREQARTLLPQAMYTEFYWKIDLHNLLNFLKLRMDSHAQKEIQDFAKACHELISPLVPITIKAFEDYVLKAVTLSHPDLMCLRTMLASDSTLEEIGKKQGLGKTEIVELEAKFRKLCINPYAIKLQNKKREDT